MDCARARMIIGPAGRPRIATPDVIAARAHVAACPVCTAHFAIDSALRHPVTAGDRRAAVVIRDQVRAAVARHRAGAQARTARRTVATALLLAAALAVAITGHAPAPGARAGATGAAFVDDYMRLAVREDHIVSDDPAAVRSFLLRALGTAPAPLAAPGLRIGGAEVCLLRGRRGALIRYDTDRGAVSHYVMPRPGARDRAPVAIGPEPGREATLVTWVRDGLEHALVGPLPATHLLDIARSAS